jgi:hypothetical protein
MLLKPNSLALPESLRKRLLENDFFGLTPREAFMAATLISFIYQTQLATGQYKEKARRHPDGWVHISTNFFKDTLSTRGAWSKIITILVESHVLERNKRFVVGQSCRKYRIAAAYRKEDWIFYNEEDIYPTFSIGRFKSPNRRLFARINSRKNLPDSLVVALNDADKQLCDLEAGVDDPLLKTARKRAQEHYKKNKVKLAAGKSKYNFNYSFKYFLDMEMASIFRVNNPAPTKIVKSNGRAYNSITNLPKEYRQFLRYKPTKEKFWNVDVATCQPLLLSTFYGSSEAEQIEKAHFIKYLLNKDFYGDIGKLAGIPTRNEAKGEAMVVMFGTKYSQNKSFALAFAGLFPILADILANIRNKSRNAYKTISLEMQRTESNIMIKGVMEEFYAANPNRPAIPIHDSFLVLLKDVAEITELIQNKFQELLGFVPRIKAEQL